MHRRRKTRKPPQYNKSNVGFTLIELLVVIGIIAMLAGMVTAAAFSLWDDNRKLHAQSMVRSVHLTMRMLREDTLIPFPDNPESTSTSDPGYLVGELAYRPDDPTDKGIVYEMVRLYDFSLNISRDLRDDGVLLDPWKKPYIYILGDADNRELESGYDEDMTQDLNKPKYSDKTAVIDGKTFREYNDWNVRDEPAYAYVYSEAGPEDTSSEDWIYVHD